MQVEHEKGLRFFILVQLALSDNENSQECVDQMKKCHYVETLMALPRALATTNDLSDDCEEYLTTLQCLQEGGNICQKVYEKANPLYVHVCDNLDNATRHLKCVMEHTDPLCKADEQEKFTKWLSKSIKSTKLSATGMDQLCCLSKENCAGPNVEKDCGKEAIEFDKSTGFKLFQGLFMIDCTDRKCTRSDAGAAAASAAPTSRQGRALVIGTMLTVLLLLLLKAWQLCSR